MPTEDKSEHDFLESREARERISLKEFLPGIVNERERKYTQSFDSIDKAVSDANIAVKNALESANATTKDALAPAYAAMKDALGTANSTISAAGLSVDKRFDAVNEFRAQLADQQETFARKSDVDAAMAAFEKATLKAEAATEKRFEAVNAFRAQLSDQQTQLVQKSEVDIRFEALEKKLDTAITQL